MSALTGGLMELLDLDLVRRVVMNRLSSCLTLPISFLFVDAGAIKSISVRLNCSRR